MFNIKFDLNLKEINNYNNELKCLYILNYFNLIDHNIVLVTNSLYEANYLYQTLSNYRDDILLFPMDDFLTSEALAISPELKITRLETLNELNNSRKRIVVTNLMGYLRYIPTKEVYKKGHISLKVNDEISIEKLAEELVSNGYTNDILVNKTGDFAKRGFVLDIFPINENNPVRIEFFGDTIESIRKFDINSQLTLEKIDSIELNTNTEFISSKEHFNVEYRNIKDYIPVTNISNYEKSTVFFNNYDEIKVSYNQLQEEMMNYSVSNNIDATTEYMHSLNISNYEEKHFTMLNDVDALYNITDIDKFSSNIDDIKKRLYNYIKNGKTVIICLSNRNIINKLLTELNDDKIIYTNINDIYDNKINVIIKRINDGFAYKNLIVISEKEIFNKSNQSMKYKTNFKIGSKIRDISKLNIGDYVVHQKHGVGKYTGIKTLSKNDLKKDYLTIEYKDNDKLYIPVEKIDTITKYSQADGVVPKINKLGGTDWIKTKLRVKAKAKDMAKELLKLYAERESSKGYSFKPDNELQLQFESEFIYQETPDQLRVIEEIKKDMESPIPMDRLVCGDVGYGKTEIAFRAMFKAISSGKQVALLCPTTILSQQHFQNAVERFKSYPINICILNRFVTAKRLSETIKKIKEGKVDIIIGTHRLLSDDVQFKNLGLLVVDEEQRFGVKHKNKIQQYRNNIDILTLSATPIPRTLQMSMSGLRSLSLLETPPSNRYPIQTYVLKENKQIVKDAIYKELSRNGQVFILDNNISNMDQKYNEILNLVPSARIVMAHGKMNKSQLEDIMYAFTNHEYDILLCTTIIETGIDIPNVNTLIIMDADRFGLSQLYQIRGRVGRSDKIAYCYLMYDNSKILNEIAVKRLKVIKEFTELGSGFSIAMRDLSIRGSGNILGSEQSGFVDSVGVELFIKMLNEEIEILKGKTILEVDNPQPLLDVETSIDDKYVKEEELKIEIHRMINEVDSYQKLLDTKAILEDRFGTLPDNLIIYMYEEWFEKEATNLGITEIKQTKNFIEINIPENILSNIDGQMLFNELFKLSKMFRFTSHYNKTYIVLDTIKLDKHFVYYLIEMIEILKKCQKK